MTINRKMYKIRESQAGFIPLELILIVIVVGMIASVGAFVWHSKQKADKLYASSASLAAKSTAPSFKSKAKATKQATTPPTTPTTTTPKTSVPTPAPQPAPVVHPTAQDIAEAKVQAYSIQTLLEGYNANYNTYPWDLTPGPLINQPGLDGATASIFDAPAGTSFAYRCLKGGGYTCTAYELKALQSNGTVIVTLNNL